MLQSQSVALPIGILVIHETPYEPFFFTCTRQVPDMTTVRTLLPSLLALCRVCVVTSLGCCPLLYHLVVFCFALGEDHHVFFSFLCVFCFFFVALLGGCFSFFCRACVMVDKDLCVGSIYHVHEGKFCDEVPRDCVVQDDQVFFTTIDKRLDPGNLAWTYLISPAGNQLNLFLRPHRDALCLNNMTYGLLKDVLLYLAQLQTSPEPYTVFVYTNLGDHEMLSPLPPKSVAVLHSGEEPRRMQLIVAIAASPCSITGLPRVLLFDCFSTLLTNSWTPFPNHLLQLFLQPGQNKLTVVRYLLASSHLNWGDKPSGWFMAIARVVDLMLLDGGVPVSEAPPVFRSFEFPWMPLSSWIIAMIDTSRLKLPPSKCSVSWMFHCL